jgi:hypothetical protein
LNQRTRVWDGILYLDRQLVGLLRANFVSLRKRYRLRLAERLLPDQVLTQLLHLLVEKFLLFLYLASFVFNCTVAFGQKML